MIAKKGLFEGELHIGGGERPAVVPAHVASQEESIGAPGVLQRPAFGELRYGVQPFVQSYQAVEDLVCNRMRVARRRHGRVERARIAALGNDQGDGLIPRRWRGAARGRGHDDQQSDRFPGGDHGGMLPQTRRKERATPSPASSARRLIADGGSMATNVVLEAQVPVWSGKEQNVRAGSLRMEGDAMDMNRRTLLMSLVAGSGTRAGQPSLAQDSAAPDPSLYIPKAHLVEERRFLHDFMDEFAFADLVTAIPALRITHIPTLLDRAAGRFGTILGHISAQNPQRAAFDGAQSAVIVFRGPHGYISPTWYAKADVVPTWNFAVVHASGRPRAIADKARTHHLLSRLIAKFEGAVKSGYDFAKLPEGYVSRMMQGIQAFEMPIDVLEGKFKLGQERSEGDRQGVLEHLRDGGYRERSLYELTEGFYRTPPK
jgi:transcriptional regulator